MRPSAPSTHPCIGPTRSQRSNAVPHANIRKSLNSKSLSLCCPRSRSNKSGSSSRGNLRASIKSDSICSRCSCLTQAAATRKPSHCESQKSILKTCLSSSTVRARSREWSLSFELRKAMVRYSKESNRTAENLLLPTVPKRNWGVGTSCGM